MSIVRVGLSETKKFAEGWEAIFGKDKASEGKKPKAPAKTGAARKGKAAASRKKTSNKK